MISAQENLPEILEEPLGIEKPEVTKNNILPLSVKADKFRREFSFKICRGIAVRKDYDTCKTELVAYNRGVIDCVDVDAFIFDGSILKGN